MMEISRLSITFLVFWGVTMEVEAHEKLILKNKLEMLHNKSKLH